MTKTSAFTALEVLDVYCAILLTYLLTNLCHTLALKHVVVVVVVVHADIREALSQELLKGHWVRSTSGKTKVLD